MKTKKSSNYQGYKKLDQALEKISEGKAPVEHDPTKKDILCPICSTRTTTKCLIKSELMGKMDPHSPFRFKFVIGCPDCKQKLEGCDRQIQEAVQQAKQNTATDYVLLPSGAKIPKPNKETQ